MVSLSSSLHIFPAVGETDDSTSWLTLPILVTSPCWSCPSDGAINKHLGPKGRGHKAKAFKCQGHGLESRDVKVSGKRRKLKLKMIQNWYVQWTLGKHQWLRNFVRHFCTVWVDCQPTFSKHSLNRSRGCPQINIQGAANLPGYKCLQALCKDLRPRPWITIKAKANDLGHKAKAKASRSQGQRLG